MSVKNREKSFFLLPYDQVGGQEKRPRSMSVKNRQKSFFLLPLHQVEGQELN